MSFRTQYRKITREASAQAAMLPRMMAMIMTGSPLAAVAPR